MNEKQLIPLLLTDLASFFGTTISNRTLYIPETYGKGYCSGFEFEDVIRVFILNYELKEDVVIENRDGKDSGKMILFKFRNVFPALETNTSRPQPDAVPSVLITTSGLAAGELVSVHSNMATINIEMNAGYLTGLLQDPGKSVVLNSLLRNDQPLLFEQVIYPSLQRIVDELIAESSGEICELFFLKIKAEELVCRLLMELEKRDENKLYALNARDIQSMYTVRDRMLEKLDEPPLIRELAASVAMSPTKLKRVFKQIFGDSVFSYYQSFRMKEAVRLLQIEQLSVSEVGYRLGFTNLSHFTRVFEAHTGMKPKRFAMTHTNAIGS